MVSHGEVPGLGLTLGVIQSSHPQGVTRPAICVISDEARINDEDRANAALIAEAGTVYHETKQTPRQILDLLNKAEREFNWIATFYENAREGATSSDLSAAAYDMRCVARAFSNKIQEALTLAKEGGQA